MRQGRNRRSSLIGGIIIFSSVAVLVTVAVMIFDAVKSATENKTLMSVVMLAVILSVSLICTAVDYFRRKIMVEKPVNKILDATDKIARGDFSARIEIDHALKHYDEYDYISENFNKMAKELSRMEVLNSDFISNVSHELKTPLSVISSYATELKNGALDENARRIYAETLVSASEKLTALVINILKLNKLEHQEINPDSEYVDLTANLSASVVEFEELVEKKGIELVCDIREGVTVYSSASYLNIVWNNLLSNAVKFTPDGGVISVGLKVENGFALVSVSDTGCGISAETGKRIFEKFYQGDTSHSQEGNGLGLALVKKVIDIIGGKISVSSEVGKGTCFRVTLKAEVLRS